MAFVPAQDARMKELMVLGSAATAPVAVANNDPDQTRGQLTLFLDMKSVAFTKLRHVGNDLGIETWRQQVEEYQPRSGRRQVAILDSLLTGTFFTGEKWQWSNRGSESWWSTGIKSLIAFLTVSKWMCVGQRSKARGTQLTSATRRWTVVHIGGNQERCV